MFFELAKDYRTTTSGWQGAPPCFQEIWPGAGFNTGDFVEEKLGAYRRTSARLCVTSVYPSLSSRGIMLERRDRQMRLFFQYSHRILEPVFVPDMDSSHWEAILLTNAVLLVLRFRPSPRPHFHFPERVTCDLLTS